MSSPYVVAQFNVGTHSKDTHLFWGRAAPGGMTLDGLNNVPSNEAIQQRIDIVSYGDLVAETSDIDVATLSHHVIVNIPGLPTDASIPCEVNFTDWNMRQVIADALHPVHYIHRMPIGWHLRWNGEHDISVPGGSVDEAVQFSMDIAVMSNMNWYDSSGTFMPIARPPDVGVLPVTRSWASAFADQQTP